MKRWIRPVFAFLLALLCWETLLTFLNERTTGYTIDQTLGEVERPGIAVNGKEGFSVFRINSDYCRGAEFDPRESVQHRVVVLGDSFTEAAQVDDKSVYVQVALQKFVKDGLHNIQMINAGQSGKSPAYYLAFGKQWLDHLHSNFLVIQLNEGDFTANFYDPSVDVYVKRSGNEFTLQHSLQKQREFARRRPRSSVLIRLKAVLGEWSGERAARDRQEARPTAFLKETLWFMHEARRVFPHVAVVYIPRMYYHDLNTLSQLTPLEVSLEAAAKAEGVPYINMRLLYARYFLETNQPCHGFNNSIPGKGHINGYGHRLLGEELYKLISPLLKP